MVKAIFFDADGTLVPFNQKKMPSSTLNALTLLRMQGVKLFVATDAHPKTLDHLREDFEFDGYITLHGQYTWTGNTVLRCQPLPPDVVKQYIQYQQSKNYSSIFLEANAIYANKINDKVKLFTTVHELPLPAVTDISRGLTEKVFQIIAFLKKEEESPLVSAIPEPEYARWSPLFVDILPKDCKKHQGMEALSQYFRFSPDEIMAFGDAESDISMLQYAKIGIAMGNGPKKLFDVADFVTKPVDEDGIFHGLVHYHLLEQD